MDDKDLLSFWKILVDNKDKQLTETELTNLTKGTMTHIVKNDCWSYLNEKQYFKQVLDIQLEDIGVDKYFEYEKEIKQIEKDEKVKREKLYHDAKVSRWKANLLLPTFILSLIGGGKAIYDITIAQIDKHSTDNQSPTIAQSQSTIHSTDRAQSRTVHFGQTTHISKTDTPQTNTHDTLTNDKK